jgi:hypothetical protein
VGSDERRAPPSPDPEPVLFPVAPAPDERVVPPVMTEPPTAPVRPPPPPPLEPPTDTFVAPPLTVTLGVEPPPERLGGVLEPTETGGVVTFAVVEGTDTEGVVATGVVTAGTDTDGVPTVVVVPGRLSAIAVAAPAAESAIAKSTAAAIRLPWAMRHRATSAGNRRNIGDLRGSG